eukprot:Gb_31208 [translate_table: standard]
MAISGFIAMLMPVICLINSIGSVSCTTNAMVPALIVFGDSTVDPGNNNRIPTVLKSNFPPYGRDFIDQKPTGRFCNGRLPMDFIAEGLGIKKTVPAYLDPHLTIEDFVTGVSFASAGTGYDNVTAHILNVIPLWKELEYFKEYQFRLKELVGEHKANSIIHEAIYLMSMGTNDFIENYLINPIRRLHFNIDQYEDFLVEIVSNFVKELYSLGGRRISVGGVPPMGCLPVERTMNFFGNSECMEGLNQVAFSFNTKLQVVVEDLKSVLSGLKIVYSDVYDVMFDVAGNPSEYGFDEEWRGCCATGTLELGYLCNEWSQFTCLNASNHMFWDSVHPTERFYEIISNDLLQRFIPKLF